MEPREKPRVHSCFFFLQKLATPRLVESQDWWNPEFQRTIRFGFLYSGIPTPRRIPSFTTYLAGGIGTKVIYLKGIGSFQHPTWNKVATHSHLRRPRFGGLLRDSAKPAHSFPTPGLGHSLPIAPARRGGMGCSARKLGCCSVASATLDLLVEHVSPLINEKHKTNNMFQPVTCSPQTKQNKITTCSHDVYLRCIPWTTCSHDSTTKRTISSIHRSSIRDLQTPPSSQTNGTQRPNRRLRLETKIKPPRLRRSHEARRRGQGLRGGGPDSKTDAQGNVESP